MTDTYSAVAALQETIAATIAALQGLPDEALGTRKEPRGISVFKTAASIEPAGRAWRLGVLLIDRDGGLYATGEVTRAIEPLRGVNNRSPEAELRRADRRAAARGHFPTGEVVNHRYEPLALDAESLAEGSGPLTVRDGVVMVRWNSAVGDAGLRPLDEYFKERIALLHED